MGVDLKSELCEIVVGSEIKQFWRVLPFGSIRIFANDACPGLVSSKVMPGNCMSFHVHSKTRMCSYT